MSNLDSIMKKDDYKTEVLRETLRYLKDMSEAGIIAFPNLLVGKIEKALREDSK